MVVVWGGIRGDLGLMFKYKKGNIRVEPPNWNYVYFSELV